MAIPNTCIFVRRAPEKAKLGRVLWSSEHIGSRDTRFPAFSAENLPTRARHLPLHASKFNDLYRLNV